jgi:hypothetical protein
MFSNIQQLIKYYWFPAVQNFLHLLNSLILNIQLQSNQTKGYVVNHYPSRLVLQIMYPALVFSAVVSDSDQVWGCKLHSFAKLVITITTTAPIVPPRSIREHVKQIEEDLHLVKVVLNKNSTNGIICLELDTIFIAANPRWQMISFGEYLSQLEQADRILPSINSFFKKSWRSYWAICSCENWARRMVQHCSLYLEQAVWHRIRIWVWVHRQECFIRR